MTECHNGDIRDRLPDFVHGQLEPSAHEAIGEHVASCAACAKEVELLRAIRATLDATPALDVDRIVASLPAAPRHGRASRIAAARSVVDWRIAAAIVALAVGAGTATLFIRPAVDGSRTPDAVAGVSTRHVPPDPKTPTAPVATPNAAASLVAMDADLADASLVELETLLRDLEQFDGLPGDPEPVPAWPVGGEEGL